MDIEQLRTRKAILELDLGNNFVERIRRFTEETGVTVTSVDIRFVITEVLGEPKAEYMIEGVTINIEL